MKGKDEEDDTDDRPGDDDGNGDPDPEALVPEAVVGQDGAAERLGWHGRVWLLPPFCRHQTVQFVVLQESVLVYLR